MLPISAFTLLQGDLAEKEVSRVGMCILLKYLKCALNKINKDVK